MGEFNFQNMYHANKCIGDPIMKAKRLFQEKNYEGVILSLTPVLADDRYSRNYINACLSNLAMAHHVLGNYDQARRYYDECDETIIRMINYCAFCHRYFEYDNMTNVMDKRSFQLQHVLNHNIMNYLLNAFGYEKAIKFWADKAQNIYDEQIFNEIRVKQGENLQNKIALECERKFAGQCQVIKDGYKDIKKTAIGIFVTDLQRHKESALVFQLVEDLSPFYEIIIYFNNLFHNKLVNILMKRVVVKDVVNYSFGEIIELLQSDKVSLVIDTAEYGLRNNSIAISNCGIKRVLLSDLKDRFSLMIRSDEYFDSYLSKKSTNNVLILGDFRYITDKELEWILINYKKDSIVFESHSLDEPVFYRTFREKLVEYGFDLDKTILQKGVLPFSEYMSFLTSFRKIILIRESTRAELSEVVKSGIPYEIISPEKMPINYDKAGLLDEINKDLQEAYFENVGIRVTEDKVLEYEEGTKSYSINCTCNGDLLVFDDIVENRYEYFTFLQ